MPEAPRTVAGSRQAKDALFEALASVAKAMGSGRRAEILELLAQGERSVEEVANAIDQSIANASHHLRVLARAGLLTSRKEGTRVIYGLANDRVGELWAAVRDVAATQLAAVERLANDYLGNRDGLQPVSRDELLSRMRRGEAILWDVRPSVEYAEGHIAGARSVPLAQLEEALAALPDDAKVVAYCRGPFCAYADEAVRRIRAGGVEAHRLEAGFPEWRRSGLPVATGQGEDVNATA